MRTDEEIEILIAKFDKDVAKRSRIMRLLLVVDQFFAVLLWNASQDETISSHVGRRISDGRANKIDKVVCWVLDKLENKHCKKSLGE